MKMKDGLTNLLMLHMKMVLILKNLKSLLLKQVGKHMILLNAINQTNFTKKYDYVSLLIGVNNQFNSRSIDEFEEDLKFDGRDEKNKKK